MRILILGGDGYLGWPTALRFSAAGHEVAVVDNFNRRRWVEGAGSNSLTPIADLETTFADTPLPALPAKVLDLRQEACELADAEHCGRFLALLWDDPHRRPAALPPLAAPNPRSA